MIITCPSCGAQYLLPDDAIGPKGRKLKCTTCEYNWREMPPLEDIDMGGSFSDLIASVEPVATQQGPKPGSTPVVRSSLLDSMPWKAFCKTALVSAFAVLAVVFVVALTIRQPLVSSWPASAYLFESIGMPVPAPGRDLVLQNVKIDTTATDTAPGILSFTAKLTNNSKQEQYVPNLKVRMGGPKGTLKDWVIPLYNQILPAGKSAALEYTLKSAPAGGQNVTLFFID